ncbi:MAG: adenylosuccinate lyase [Elusimicrobiota bacterium]
MIQRYTRPEMARIWDPETRIRRMLEVELAWIEAIARPKGIPAAQVAAFRRLAGRGRFSAKVRRKEAKSAHDVVALLEVVSAALRRGSPEVVRYLHYGLTSSDVLDTVLALQLRDAADLLLAGWRAVTIRIKALARRHAATWMAGRTHGVHAEPMAFGLKLAGWHAEARRDAARLQEARRHIAYGKLSGAVGSFAHASPALEAAVLRKLGLRPEPVSTQVVPRDRHAAYLQAVALSACAIERFAVEIRHLQRTEVLEVSEPFGRGQKGSSAMPHKRNPVLCENLCGLARLVRAHSSAALENVALWHERDISHSSVERVALPDATVLLDFMLHRFAGVLRGLVIDPARMRKNLESSLGLAFSQGVLLALIDKGLGRMEAYDVVQRAAMETWRGWRPLRDTLAADPEVRRRLPGAELERCFDLARYGRATRRILEREGIL